MAERKDNSKNKVCAKWEMQLVDALDGLLAPADEAAFNLHRTTCAACDEMYEAARRGQEWLGFLSEAPPVPEGLLERLLTQTGPNARFNASLTPAIAGMPATMPPVWQRPSLMVRTGRFMASYMQPRLMMTAAMAFFSIALTLNLAGFRLDRMHLGWVRPNIVRSYMERHITAASTPIVRLYDHMRESYEVDSKVRVIEKTTERITAPLKQAVPQQDEQQESKPVPKGGAHLQTPSERNNTPKNERSSVKEIRLQHSLQSELHIPQSPALFSTRERKSPWNA
jgi:hypothetical protein